MTTHTETTDEPPSNIAANPLQEPIAHRMIETANEDELHHVTVGDGHTATTISMAVIDGAAAVLREGNGHEQAWQGWVDDAVRRFKREVQNELEAARKFEDGDITVNYNAGDLDIDLGIEGGQ